MKSIAALLTVLVLVPAIIVACHCCKAVPENSLPRIEKAACDSCCPESSVIVRDCGAIHEKQMVSHSHERILVASTNTETKLVSNVSEAVQLPGIKTVSPLNPLTFSVVLRI